MCRHWAAATSGVQAMGFSRAGIGVFWVAAMGFSSVGIGVFVVAAMGFSSAGIGVFVGRGIGLAELSAPAPVFFWEKTSSCAKKREHVDPPKRKRRIASVAECIAIGHLARRSYLAT